MTAPSLRLVSVAVLAMALSACETPSKPSAPAPVPPTPTLQTFMDTAAKANKDGSRIKERESYRAAANAYPTAKEPWLKLAEGYFEEADYGNTILASQEVLHRDASDQVATSMLAVSGLRVANTALASLRKQNSLGADTRSQAEGVAKQLREVLGEPVLVPKTDAKPAAPKPQAPKPAQPTKPAAAPAEAKPSNPFDKLKN